MPKVKASRPVQYDLFGHPIEEAKPPGTGEIMPFDFESHAVRVVMIKGEPWFVASDVCRVLEILNCSETIRGKERTRKDGSVHWSGGLDSDEWAIDAVYTHSGSQEMLVVNEWGFYSLVMRSRTPKAKQFQRWVVHEVLPSIRRTGFYISPRSSRVSRVAKRLGCDSETAKTRCDQIDINKASHSRLASDKGCPRDFQEWHNGAYRGMFGGLEARDLRKTLGLASGETPLDHMDRVPLSVNTHAKVIADRFVREHNVPLADQPAVIERIARETAENGIAMFGNAFMFGMSEHERRGRIIDVVRKQIPQAVN